LGERTARQEDTVLMADLAVGDRAALARLVERHGRGLGIVAARYLGDEAEAEEVVQEAFLRAWRSAARYDPARGAPATWLYRIAVNLCIDRRRRRGLRRFVGLEEAPEPADPAPDALDRADGRARLERVRGLIAALPARQRMALLLAAVAGLDTGEIARSMGTSRGSAEQLLVRARRRLRAELGEEEDVR
jgi:RNA polymerase sigma-70 factor (ECF subfamily)